MPKQSMPKQSKTKLTPEQWFVTVSARDCTTGKSVCLVQHQCASRFHGSMVMTEIRATLADIAELVPGLSAAGYEVVAPSIVPITPYRRASGPRNGAD